MQANEYNRAACILNHCSNHRLYTPKFGDFKTTNDTTDLQHTGYRGLDENEKRLLETAIKRFKSSYDMGLESITTEFAYGVGILYTNTEEDNWQDRKILNKKEMYMFIKISSCKGAGVIAVSTDMSADYIHYYAVYISSKTGKDSGDFKLLPNKAN